MLENRIEEGLTLEEQRAAWAEYEAESKAKVQAQAQAQASAQLLHDELIRNTADQIANFADENSNDSTQSDLTHRIREGHNEEKGKLVVSLHLN